MTAPTAEESRAFLDSLTGYTPAPWQRVGWQPCGIYGPGELTNAPRIASMDRRAQHDGDACLIVAAPDLATHLRAAIDREAAALVQIGELAEQVGWFGNDLRRAEAERDALRAALGRIATMDTPSGNATVRRMVSVARDALDKGDTQ